MKNIQKKAKQLGIESKSRAFLTLLPKKIWRKVCTLADACYGRWSDGAKTPEGLDLRALLKILPADKDVGRGWTIGQ